MSLPDLVTCLLHGHDDGLRVSRTHLAVACQRCGRTTPGIEIGDRREHQALSWRSSLYGLLSAFCRGRLSSVRFSYLTRH
jgi:hypothetical protein